MDEDIIQRIQALPPELYNQIRAEVLDFDLTSPLANQRYKPITSSYSFPIHLHINAASRREHAERYFANIFVFSSVEVLRKFIAVLTKEHRESIWEIQSIEWREGTPPEYWSAVGPAFERMMVNAMAKGTGYWVQHKLTTADLLLDGRLRANDVAIPPSNAKIIVRCIRSRRAALDGDFF